MSKEQIYSPEIKEIENEIVQFLTNSPLFMGQNPLLTKIKAYFATRKNLTQANLQELTGYSSGAVSQALKELVSLGFIDKKKISNKGKIIYFMKSVELAYIKANIDGLMNALQLGEKITNLKTELENNKEQLQKLHGFDVVYKWTEIFRDFLADPMVNEIIKQMERKIEELERLLNKESR